MAGAGDRNNSLKPSPGPTAASTSPVFNPGTVTSTALGSTSTYDPFGLPTGMGDQRIYVGYTAPGDRVTPGQGHGSDALSNQTDGISGVKNSNVSVSDLMKHFHDLATSSNPASRASWAQTQQQLQAMNAFGSDTRINYGAWGDQDATALQKALTGYLQGGNTNLQTFEEYVANTAAQGAANGLDKNQPGAPGGGGGVKRAPLSETNTADLNAAIDNTSQQYLGQAAPAGQAGQFASQYHGQEQDAYTAAGVANGGAYQQPATAADAARQFIVDHNLPQYAAHQAESFMNVFANMFLSGQSARANTSLGDVAVGGK